MTGLALQARLKELGSRLPIVFITGHADVPTAVAALRAGALSFVTKPYREQELLDSINEALARDAAEHNAAVKDTRFAAALDTLTEREREVMDLAVTGLPSKEIAQRLGISHRTVELHRSRVLEKTGVTSMADPHICVPPQFASSRKVKTGDVVFCELSAMWWDYAGQVLRSFTVGADPTPLYRDLHATAEAAFDAVTSVIRQGTTMEQIVDAAAVIEERGFTIYDDLMHGFGGGYLQPIVGTKSRPAGPLPDMTLEENMTVVVQPNVISRDQPAGVQVGELIRVTREGFERLHAAPRGFFRA